jgi:cytochrome c biogenesis protein ResB
MKSWKTTSAGIIMILGAITGLLLHNGMFTQEVIMGAATAILGGIGLIFAKDSDVSGKSR